MSICTRSRGAFLNMSVQLMQVSSRWIMCLAWLDSEGFYEFFLAVRKRLECEWERANAILYSSVAWVGPRLLRQANFCHIVCVVVCPSEEHPISICCLHAPLPQSQGLLGSMPALQDKFQWLYSSWQHESAFKCMCATSFVKSMEIYTLVNKASLLASMVPLNL